MDNKVTAKRSLPIIVLDEMVVLPGEPEKITFSGEDVAAIAALQYAIDNHCDIFVTSSNRKIKSDDRRPGKFESIGVIASIKHITKNAFNRTAVVHFHVKCRARITDYIEQKGGIARVTAAMLPSLCDYSPQEEEFARDKLMGVVSSLQRSYTGRKLTEKEAADAAEMTSLGELCDYLVDKLVPNADLRKEVLFSVKVEERMVKTISALKSVMLFQEMRESIDRQVRENVEKNQHDYFLREQLKVIYSELGEGDSVQAEAEAFRQRIEALTLEDNTAKHLLSECDRLQKSAQNSQEAAVIRSYLEFVLSLPWETRSAETTDIANAQKVLDRDHYGMEKVKERIIELVAVRKLAPESKGQILCLAGPPGVGKTSIARSVAQALGREYVRVSLGGVRDEADIRGHRKTYIGAMAGRILSAIKQAGTRNPLVLLDEVDKLGSDYRGDPSAALLETLDPEQNSHFVDHYAEVPFDLSEVLFITTANDYTRIPAPLRDRMDIIHMPSYTQEEKHIIAKRHLIPKQMKANGLCGNTMRVSDDVIDEIIALYTREAGVRTLERRIAELMRKAAAKIASGQCKRVTVRCKDLAAMLGAPKYRKEIAENITEPGVVNGLAYTAVGGTLLEIEVALLRGRGKLALTGSLGDVMKESAAIAVSAVRQHAQQYGIAPNFHEKYDIHIHAPEGAVHKDGPSAGITMATAIVSALTGIPARSDVAMTGEISLRGRVLPIGGLREKTMAAYIAGITTVIIPADNEPDIEELSDAVKSSINFVCVRSFDEVIRRALVTVPQPRAVDCADEISDDGGEEDETAEG